VLRDVSSRGELPDSGKGLVSTLRDRKKRTDRTGDPSSAPHPAAPPPAAPAEEPAPAVQAVHVQLERMTYVQAVLWLAVRLAAGPTGWGTPTTAASCIATSSRPTSC